MTIKAILLAAANYAIKTCVIGASNRMDDIEKTNGWVFFHKYRYNQPGSYVKPKNRQPDESELTDLYFDLSKSMLYVKTNRQWFYRCDHYEKATTVDFYLFPKRNNFNPLCDPTFFLKKSHLNLLLLAVLTKTKREGNCHERCCLVAKFLWENNKGIQKIEIIQFNFDHLVVLVNREGELNDPMTWGSAWVVDAWSREMPSVYAATDFLINAQAVKKFMIEDCERQVKVIPSKAKTLATFQNAPAEITWALAHEAIAPHENLYPTYSTNPFYPVEHYYELLNDYPKNLVKNGENPLGLFQQKHRDQFKHCLSELSNLTQTSSKSTKQC